MKVAILGSLPLEHGGTGIGGLSVHTAQISRHLVRQGVEVDVAAWNIPSSSPQRITSPDGYEIHRLATIRSKETVAQLMRRFPGMIRLPVPGSQALSLRHRLAVLLLAAQIDGKLAEIRPDLREILNQMLSFLKETERAIDQSRAFYEADGPKS